MKVPTKKNTQVALLSEQFLLFVVYAYTTDERNRPEALKSVAVCSLPPLLKVKLSPV